MGIPLSPTRLRRRSFLNDPPGLPGHSILLNCPTREQGRDPSPNPSSSSSHGHSHAEADAIAAKAASGSVSFAPLPVIPPELKRRSSITLGVAARKNLLSSPEDEIYPDPKKKREAEEAAAAAAAAGGEAPPPHAGGGRPGGRNTGAVRSVYMSDEDWEAYKRRYQTKNGGNDVVDIGELVTTQAKNLWRRVKPVQKADGTPGTPSSSGTGPAASPSSSTTGSMLSSITSPKLGTSPNGGILGSFTSPRLSIRRRSDPGTSSAASTKEAGTTKSPELPKVEEESLSRRESTESKIIEHTPGSPPPTSPTSPKYMDWDKKKTSRSASMDSTDHHSPAIEAAATPPSITSPRGPPSPPPRVQDVLPSEDELREHRQDKDKEVTGHETESERDDEFKDAEDGHADGTLGLERVEIQSEAGDYGHQAPQQRYTRDSAVLGFDRSRFHEE